MNSDEKGELDKVSHLHILKDHDDYSSKLRKVFNLMTIQGSYSVIGSGAIEEVKYKGDYDLQSFPKIKDPYKAGSYLLKKFQEKFKTAEENPNLFITDLKMGDDFKKYPEPIRWNKKTIAAGFQMVDGVKVTFEDAVLMKSKSNKIDVVQLIDGVFIELARITTSRVEHFHRSQKLIGVIYCMRCAERHTQSSFTGMYGKHASDAFLL